MGWRDAGFMGSEFYETPNIDRLSKEGMIFTQGYAAASNCAPSRASLLTGEWPTKHGIYTVGTSERGNSKDRKIIPIKNQTSLNENEVLLPQIFKNTGYATCHAGKWHVSGDPLQNGFDVNIGGSHSGNPQSYYPPYKNVDLEGSNEKYLTDLIMDKALTFVKNTKKPFFLYYAPYAVHTPIQGIDSLRHKFAGKKPWKGQDNVDYATMLNNVDRNIGYLISELKRLGIYDNTFIIFTSDNGGLHPITEQKPLRAGKGSYYEGGIRVPFFFVWKGKIKPGAVNSTPITNLDIFPTLMELTSAQNSKNLDGNGLLRMLTKNKKLKKRDLFWYFPIYLESATENNENRDPLFRTRPGAVIRSGDWKLHYYFENSDFELFNLKNDIGEQHNLAQTHPIKAKKLLLKLKQWMMENDAPIPDKPNPDYVGK